MMSMVQRESKSGSGGADGNISQDACKQKFMSKNDKHSCSTSISALLNFNPLSNIQPKGQWQPHEGPRTGKNPQTQPVIGIRLPSCIPCLPT